MTCTSTFVVLQEAMDQHTHHEVKLTLVSTNNLVLMNSINHIKLWPHPTELHQL